MRIPPADLGYLRDQFNDLAAQIHEYWESSALAESESDSPGMLRDAMAQLVDMLSPLDRGEHGDKPQRAEVNTLGEYGLHLIDELSAMAQRVNQPELSADVECLSLPFALWIARNEGEIRNLASIVNALAQFANRTTQPQAMGVHLRIGGQRPEIVGEDLSGEAFKLSDYAGKVILLDFWGHW